MIFNPFHLTDLTQFVAKIVKNASEYFWYSENIQYEHVIEMDILLPHMTTYALLT